MTTSNLQHLSRYDTLVFDKLKELPTDISRVNTYHGVILRYFLHLNEARRQRLDQGRGWIGVEAKPVTEAFRELWVVKAGKESTFEIFKDYEQFEKFLFRSPDYRGHYVHQFDVFLLGYWILNKILLECDELSQKLQVLNNPNFTWMLASTFHDMGYPIEQIEKWFSDFLKMFLKVETSYQMEIEKLLSPSFYDYLGYLSEEHDALKKRTLLVSGELVGRNWRFHEKLLASLRKKDHGVISALLLMHSLLTQEKISRYQDWFYGTLPYEIMPACHAISIHNLNLEDFKIDLSTYPYAFLLTLCDVLQDWRRSLHSRDYSELVDFTFRCNPSPPSLEFKVKINVSNKEKEILGLPNRLTTGGLMTVTIRRENGDPLCTIQ